MLEVRNVVKRFRGVVALADASLRVDEGEIVGLIGPNGAGKSTLFNCVTRLYDWDAGEVRFLGRSVARLRMHQIVYHGIARTFQNTVLIPRLTLRENVSLGALVGARRVNGSSARGRDGSSDVDEVIERLGLGDVGDALPHEVPLLTKKRVEIARALATQPRLLLLDEPATGLDPSGVSAIDSLLREFRSARNITILLVEHNVSLVAGIADSIAVLNFGRSIAQADAREVMSNDAVIEAYLGRDE